MLKMHRNRKVLVNNVGADARRALPIIRGACQSTDRLTYPFTYCNVSIDLALWVRDEELVK